MIQTFKQYKLWKTSSFHMVLLVCAIMFTHLWLIFPPCLQGDSSSMYSDAVNLCYRDYWPPLTLLLWHGLNYVKAGADLMLLLNLGCLWIACIIGICVFKGQKIAYWFLVIPFVPSIFLDAGEILKDTIFSFGYMLMVMMLARKTIKQKSLALLETLLFSVCIFYFSMVKVQAQFIFPFMVAWIVWLQPALNLKAKTNIFCKIMIFIVFSVGIFFGMRECNNCLIQKQNNAHFWQYVKIYDLAGMSVFANKMYVPDFLLKNPKVTVQNIKDHYDYLWEPLIRYDHSPLVSTHNDQEREDLVIVWKKYVLKDPIAYLKHRGRLWIKILGGSALKGSYVEWTKNSPGWLRFAPIFSLFSFLPLFPIFLCFWWLGVKNLRKNNYAVPLFMLSSMGLSLIFVLFVFSLASAGRYIYFSWCCFMFSVPFAYRTWVMSRAKIL